MAAAAEGRPRRGSILAANDASVRLARSNSISVDPGSGDGNTDAAAAAPTGGTRARTLSSASALVDIASEGPGLVATAAERGRATVTDRVGDCSLCHVPAELEPVRSAAGRTRGA